MACRWGSTSRVRRAGTPSCRQDVETRPDTSLRRRRGRGNAYIVSFLPGMTTSQFSRSVDPSALLRGRATKPMGWSLRQLRRSSRRRPSAMPAISLVRRGLRGAAGGSRRVGQAGSERASAAVVATVPVAVCRLRRPPGFECSPEGARSTGRSDGTSLRLARTSKGRVGGFFVFSLVDQTSAIRTRLAMFQIALLRARPPSRLTGKRGPPTPSPRV